MNPLPLQPRLQTLLPGRPWQIGSPDGFEWTRATLPIPGLSPHLAGFRILHLTDLHFRPRWWDAYDRVLQITNENPPDLILCTGDFVEQKWNQARALPVLERFIGGLHARLGIWGILGNHDGDLLLPQLLHLPLHLLNRGRTIIETAGNSIELIGLPGVHRWDLDEEFLHAIPPRDPSRLRIIMQHYPDQIRHTSALNPDLVLAGHTHGGQVGFPGGRPIIKHDSLPTPFCSGIHRYESTWLIVSRGLGFSTIPIRLFCPPQIIEIVLEASNEC